MLVIQRTGVCSNFFLNHSENFRRESLSHDAPIDHINENMNQGSINSPRRSAASGDAALSDLNEQQRKSIDHVRQIKCTHLMSTYM
jgi:hypothetical protein